MAHDEVQPLCVKGRNASVRESVCFNGRLVLVKRKGGGNKRRNVTSNFYFYYYYFFFKRLKSPDNCESIGL